MTLALAIDLLLAGLLIATLVYGSMLNRRLMRLRQDRDQLAAVVAEFDAATGRAVAGMDALRAAADASGASLQGVVDRARATIEDLTFLVERGERAAGRLEAATRPEALRKTGPQDAAPRLGPAAGAAGPVPPGPVPGPVPPGGASGDGLPASAERQALLKVLEKMR